MTLFSWFSQKHPKIICKDSLKEELKTFNNNTMWPIAQVRNSSIVTQQQFINELHNKTQKVQSVALKEKTL